MRINMFEVTRKDIKPLVVEAHAIDHGLVLTETEQAWFRVAVLRQRGHRAAFGKPEACADHGHWHISVLVETSSQPDTVREGQDTTVISDIDQ